MATVDYFPIANGLTAVVESQAAYVADLAPGGACQNGYPSGLVPATRMNKSLRQMSMIGAAVANMISGALAIDVLDDGNLGNLIANLNAAIAQLAINAVGPAVPSGMVGAYVGSAAPAGWVLAIGTIGNGASGGTRRANADTVNLFTLLWNNWADAQAPVSGGRGGSAAADFAANKTITVPDMRGRAIFGLDNLGGAAANRITNAVSGIVGTTMGATGGDQSTQTHTHVAVSVVTDPMHIHNQQADTAIGDAGASWAGAANPSVAFGGVTQAAATGITVATNNANFGAGNSQNMPPAVVMSVIVKL